MGELAEIEERKVNYEKYGVAFPDTVYDTVYDTDQETKKGKVVTMTVRQMVDTLNKTIRAKELDRLKHKLKALNPMIRVIKR